MNGKAGGQKPGKSPLMMCGSVPQMNVVSTRHKTSSASSPAGTGTSSIADCLGARSTSARMDEGMDDINPR
jgi:hypothetical protein